MAGRPVLVDEPAVVPWPSGSEAGGYTLTRRVNLPYAAVVPRVLEGLRSQGFGALTEIDIAAVLRKRLGVDTQPYLILGACDADLALRALNAEPEAGVLLPCNVVIGGDGDATLVQAVDPAVMARVSGEPEVHAVAREARRLLQAALDSLQDTGTEAPQADAERRRSLSIPVAYGAVDIERAAESIHVSLSDEETSALLARIDVDLDDLGHAATQSAVYSRIYDELARIGHLHESSDDD